MKHSIKFLPLLLALGTQRPAQAPATPQTSAAEQAFRDGWWAESGQNDLDAALRLYLAAAIADGPAEVRGKALLHAGALQQRLGKTDAAIATLRQVLREHGGNAELTARAQTHLRELTAVDLRKGYDEWYERALFSEETQLRVLTKVQELAAALAAAEVFVGKPDDATAQANEQRIRAAKAALLGFGKAAAPALRKAAVGKPGPMTLAATQMLFDIGELPPDETLARGEGFGSETSHWALLLAHGGGRRLPDVKPAAPLNRLVAAALRGPAELLRAITTTTDSTVISDGACLISASRALLQHDASQTSAVLAAIASPEVPRSVRRALEASLVDDQDRPVDLTAAQWFAVSEDPLNPPTRRVGIEHAVAKLSAQDGELFDRLLERIRTALPTGREQLAQGAFDALSHHETIERLPWSPNRLRGVLTLSPAALYMLTAVVRDDARLRPMTAQALLEHPVELCTAIHPERDLGTINEILRNHFNDEGEDYELDLRVQRWSAAMAKELATRWPGYDDDARKAALVILHAAVRERGAHHDLLATLRKLRDGASAEVLAALDAAITAYTQNG